MSVAAERITAAAVGRLTAGETAWDSEVRGFGVRRQARDAVYVLKTRIRGRQRFLTIGRHQPGVMTPDRARKEAIRLLGLARDGRDPARERQATKAVPTVAALCDTYLEAIPTLLLRRAGRAKKESTLVTDRSRIARHIRPLLGDLRVDEVTPAHVEAFMHRIAAGDTAAEGTERKGGARVRGGRGAAARTVGLLGAVFAYAQKCGFRPDNPVRGVVRPADGRRERRLSDAEYAALGQGMARAASAGVSPTGLAALRLLLLTGWRKSEATGLRWAELDLPRRTARLGDTKSGASVRPLAQAVVELISAQPRTSGPHVFPARVGGRPFQGLPRVWERVRGLAGLPADVTLHTLRHSFASLADDLGYGEAAIAGLLGHRRASMTARYTHAADAVLLGAADKVANAVLTRSASESATGDPRAETPAFGAYPAS